MVLSVGGTTPWSFRAYCVPTNGGCVSVAGGHGRLLADAFEVDRARRDGIESRASRASHSVAEIVTAVRSVSTRIALLRADRMTNSLRPTCTVALTG